MKNNKIAVVFGATGQDGKYLCELLLEKDFHVFAVKRRTSGNSLGRISHLENKTGFDVLEGDITDINSVEEILHSSNEINEVYNLAAQSVTGDSLLPIKTGNQVKYVDFESLWKNMSVKRDIRTEDFNGTEVEVIDIKPTENTLSALGHSNSMGNWYKITQISRHKWNGKVAKLSQKFGSVTVTPNHSLIDIFGNVVQPETNPWMLNIRKINSVVKTPLNYIKFPYIRVNEDFSILETGGQFVKDICSFIGAFVSEGHTTYNKATDTYSVNISEQNKLWLEDLEESLDKFSKIERKYYCIHKKEGYKDVYRLEIQDRYLYDLMRKWCGIDSKTKQLPDWFTRLSKEDAKVLFNKLIEGDGCYTQEGGWRYTTSSYKLACQLSWLFTYLGYEYTVNEEGDGIWHFRSCEFYQLNQGESGKKITWLDYDGYVYDITVDEVHNFTVGVGNIVVHNSHVATSFNQPFYTFQATALGCVNILEVLRKDPEAFKETRFYQASSSEMFGSSFSTRVGIIPGTTHNFQDETTSMHPQSPYAVAKLNAHKMCQLYRKAYDMFICSGILFNHESPYRGENFVTRKITKWLGEFNAWKDDSCNIEFDENNIIQTGASFPKLRLGNLEAKRDWGHAKDYVYAMYLMLQQDKPDDYVISTQETQSVRDFVDIAFKESGIEDDPMNYIVIDPAFYRPAEVDYLLGDSSKARTLLGWKPEHSFKDLVKEMVEYDAEQARK